MLKQDAFNRSKSPGSLENFKGAEIGLAVCKKIIEQYNGDFWDSSPNEKGTTYNFTMCTDKKSE